MVAAEAELENRKSVAQQHCEEHSQIAVGMVLTASVVLQHL